MNCTWPCKSLVIDKTSMAAGLITPPLPLPYLVADTPGPEMLFLALASTVSITTSMSLAGALSITALQELTVCHILQRTDLVLIRSCTEFHNI